MNNGFFGMGGNVFQKLTGVISPVIQRFVKNRQGNHQVIEPDVPDQANVNLVLSPKGSGAIVTQVADNTVLGGNQRGSFAVDLQSSRSNSDHVAAGNYSVVGGGQNNRVFANLAINSDFATVSGGYQCSASGAYTTVAGGRENSATSTEATVCGGRSNLARANSCVGGGFDNQIFLNPSDYSVIGGGRSNRIYKNYNVAVGGQSTYIAGTYCTTLGGFETRIGILSTQEDYGKVAYASAGEESQWGMKVLTRTTIDATPLYLTADNGSTETGNKVYQLFDNQIVAFRVLIVARLSTGAERAAYEITGLAERGAGAATAAIVGTPSVTVIHEDVAAWDVAAEADTTGGGFRIKCTGEAGKSIKWVATIFATEVKA